MTETVPELFHFEHSHYNEKARWALDFKAVPHRRTALLPGPHVPYVRRLSGQTMTPVLRVNGSVVAGSARIVGYLEAGYPEPALYPADPGLRAEALAVAAWFDDEIGAPARCAYFCDVLPDHAYMGRVFTGDRENLGARVYRAGFPALHQVLKRVYRLTPENAEAGRQAVQRALDRIADQTRKDGYFVGGRFTVADLTAASILSLMYFPPQFPTPLPEPRAPGMVAWLARWRDHPARDWILRMYAEHRGRSAALPD